MNYILILNLFLLIYNNLKNKYIEKNIGSIESGILGNNNIIIPNKILSMTEKRV